MINERSRHLLYNPSLPDWYTLLDEPYCPGNGWTVWIWLLIWLACNRCYTTSLQRVSQRVDVRIDLLCEAMTLELIMALGLRSSAFYSFAHIFWRTPSKSVLQNFDALWSTYFHGKICMICGISLIRCTRPLWRFLNRRREQWWMEMMLLRGRSDRERTFWAPWVQEFPCLDILIFTDFYCSEGKHECIKRGQARRVWTYWTSVVRLLLVSAKYPYVTLVGRA